MAHEIDMTTGSAAIAYYGETPWHGLGKKMDGMMTSEEALKAAGLDYTVEMYPAYFFDGTQHVQVLGRSIPVRTDTMAGLGGTSDKFKPIQNKDAFSFLDSLSMDGIVRYEVAGALRGGSQVWMLAKLPTSTVISDEDVVNHYLLLSNSHDGMKSCSVGFTTVRVVCANTLSIAAKGLRHEYRIRHTGNIQTKLDDAKTVLGLAGQTFVEFSEASKRLSFKQYRNQEQVDAFLNLVLGITKEPSKQQKLGKERLKELIETGTGADLSTAKGTYWGLVNAVTEFVDHDRPNQGRSKRDEDEVRVESIAWGTGNALKQKAWNLALAVL